MSCARDFRTHPGSASFDTGARHKGRNAVCTQIGNDSFAWFGTTYSKSRVNFLECLRAGFTDYVVNDEALAYMREQHMPAFLVARLAADGERSFADPEAWSAHLRRLGISELETNPDSTRVATEGALLGAVLAHGFLAMAVILSDDAGLPGLDPGINVLYHALCWVHAERPRIAVRGSTPSTKPIAPLSRPCAAKSGTSTATSSPTRTPLRAAPRPNWKPASTPYSRAAPASPRSTNS